MKMSGTPRPTDAYLQKIMNQVRVDDLESDPEHVRKLTVLQNRFLEAYKQVGVITKACKIAKCNRKSHYNWCKKSASYRAAFIDAEMEARDEILETCRRVALDDKNVAMLIHMSKGMFPELFSVTKHEISGPGGGAISMRSNGSVDQILERINDIVSKRQQAIDSQVDPTRLLEGSQDGMEHSEESGRESGTSQGIDCCDAAE